jgi:hypothetical protein
MYLFYHVRYNVVCHIMLLGVGFHRVSSGTLKGAGTQRATFLDLESDALRTSSTGINSEFRFESTIF